MSDRCEWVQIVEPRSREYMYANLVTGECLWEPPAAVPIKESDNSEWWELFDTNTNRFYYYSTQQQTTVWHRPEGCDIIPLAKLQALKRSSYGSKEEDELNSILTKEISTQTFTPGQNGSNNNNKSCFEASGKPADKPNVSPSEAETELAKTGGLIDHDKQRKRDKSHQLTSKESTRQPTPPSMTQQPVKKRQQRQDLVQPSPLPPQPLAWSSKLAPRPPAPQRSLSSPISSSHLALDIPKSTGFHRSPETKMLVSDVASSVPPDYIQPPAFLRQESYPLGSRESYHQFEAGFHQPDVNQIMAVQVTPISRPRAFPRTNPSYVGTYRRDGQGTAYKRISIDPHHAMPSVCNDCFDISKCRHTHSIVPMSVGTSTLNSRSVYANIASGLVPAEACACDDADAEVAAIGMKQQPTIQQDAQLPKCSFVPVHLHRQQHHPNNRDDGVYMFSDKCNMADHQYCNRTAYDMHGLQTPGQKPFLQCQDVAPANRLPAEMQLVCHPVMKHHRRDENMAHSENGNADMSTLEQRRKSEPEYVNLATRFSRSKQAKASTNKRSVFGQINNSGLNASSGSRTDFGNTHNGHSPRLGDHYRPVDLCHRLNVTDGLRISSNRGFSSKFSDGVPEFDFDDSDHGSAQSTPSPQNQQFQTLMPFKPQSSSTYHPSLRKKKWMDKPQPQICQSTLEKSWSLQAELAQHRPMSVLTQHPSESNIIANKVAGTLLQQMHIEQFVMENLNEHRKGILGKTVSIGHMLSWTKDSIQKPMIRTVNKVVKKEAPELFRSIQVYMGDKKAKEPLSQIALEIVVKGWTVAELRDEVFIQLCRQTSKNPREESIVQGWELLGICLAFFPPSVKFYSYLSGHIQKNIDAYSHLDKSLTYFYTVSCERRLQWVVHAGAKRGLRKPSHEEVEQAKKSLIEPSMFGSTLEEILSLQKDRFPDRWLPWIQTALSEEVLRLNGAQTEGIFRVPGDIDEVNALKVQCDRWTLPVNCTNPHVPASLLKLWYRELYEPLIPFSFYSQCMDNFANPEGAVAIVNRLPEINRLVLTYLIRFLQEFTKPENSSATKMDVNNLAMVMAPNCLRCVSHDPKVIFENTRKEMVFIRTLILNLDTGSIQALL